MYLQHFGLHEKPFSITPDPDFMLMTEAHEEALAALEYGVYEQSGITVLTGDVGCGKTTLLRHLLARIPEDEVCVGLVSNIHASLGDLMSWVMLAFELDAEGRTNAQNFRRLQEFFVAQYAAGKKVVLVIDEAQNLAAADLEELRMLSNINAEKDEILQIVLIGQPELRTMLTQPCMAQTAQRVTAEFHLGALTLEETAAYVAHRLGVAGASPELVDSGAIELIHKFSAGVPRLINTLCDFALAAAYGLDVPVVDADIVAAVAEQKPIGGLHQTVRC